MGRSAEQVGFFYFPQKTKKSRRGSVNLTLKQTSRCFLVYRTATIAYTKDVNVKTVEEARETSGVN